MEGSSIRVIVRGVTPGRVTRLYPGRGALPRTRWHIGLTQQVRWAVRPWAGLRGPALPDLIVLEVGVAEVPQGRPEGARGRLACVFRPLVPPVAVWAGL